MLIPAWLLVFCGGWLAGVAGVLLLGVWLNRRERRRRQASDWTRRAAWSESDRLN